jgi:hypothetical protein
MSVLRLVGEDCRVRRWTMDYFFYIFFRPIALLKCKDAKQSDRT